MSSILGVELFRYLFLQCTQHYFIFSQTSYVGGCRDLILEEGRGQKVAKAIRKGLCLWVISWPMGGGGVVCWGQWPFAVWERGHKGTLYTTYSLTSVCKNVPPLEMGSTNLTWPIHCKDTKPKIRNKYSHERGLSANFHIHVSVSDLHIPRIGLPFLLIEKYEDRSYKIAHRFMNGEIGTEAAQFLSGNT